MFKKLFPQKDLFFVFFEKHATVSCQAAELLSQFIDSEHKSEEIFQMIKRCESDADTITHQCVETLHKTFITPMDRQDIYRLITTLDDIADEIEDSAKRIFLYKLEALPKETAQFAKIVVSSVNEVLSAVKELRKMKITDSIRRHFYTINHLENEADSLLNHAISRLFDEEPDPKTLIKCKEVFEHLESATDVCEDVSNIIEGIILENE